MSTSTGSSAQLVLRNVSSRPPATASIQVTTADGPASMEGRSQVIVPPAGEEQTVLLESIVPGEEAIGVDVSVLGAPLSMHLQTTERDGLTPPVVPRSSAPPSAKLRRDRPAGCRELRGALPSWS